MAREKGSSAWPSLCPKFPHLARVGPAHGLRVGKVDSSENYGEKKVGENAGRQKPRKICGRSGTQNRRPTLFK